MNRIQRTILPLLLACAPWLAHAQADPCTPSHADGRQSANPCVPANASGGVDTGSSDGLFHFSWVAPELDAACRESTDQAGLTCAREVNAANQRCWRTRLTPMCQAQMTSPSAPRDPACTVQSMRVCTALSDYPHCIQRELPGGCMAQVRKANRERERKTSHCARDDQGEAAAIKACHGGGRIPWEVDTCVAKVRRAACH